VSTSEVGQSKLTKTTDQDQTSQRRGKAGFLTRIGQGMNYDFCPSYNQYVYWLKTPIGWVISAILFSALVGLIIGPQGFILMWSLIAFLAVGAVWPWLGMKGIQCRLDFDTVNTEEQAPTFARLTVRNRWPIPIFGLTLEGHFLQDIYQEEDRVAVGLQRIPGWSESEFVWEFAPARRGILPIDPPVIASGFPFGLYQCEKGVSIDRQVIVWPKCEELNSIRGIDGTNFNIDGNFSDRPGYDGDVIGARPYRQGDMLRHVNWAKTARTGKLVVLERQTAAQKSIRVVIDLHPSRHQGAESQSTYEWAIRVAASIVKHLHLHQSHIRLSCIGIPQGQAQEMTNSRGLEPVLDFLATLPTLETLKQTFDESPTLFQDQTVQTVLANIRGDEEVFWIRTPDSKTNLPAIRRAISEIIVDYGNDPLFHTQSSESELESDNAETLTIRLDESSCQTRQQFQDGWERLCSD
jgi:uncharacterized protein (DUF58 family)